jgi:PBSX family phage terminase large subunit
MWSKQEYENVKAELEGPKKKQEEVRVSFNKTYKPHERQALAHAAPQRFILFGGALGGGKSVWLCMEAIMLSIDYPGNVGYLCRHENVSLKRTTLVTLKQYLPEALVEKHHQQDQCFTLKNGSKILYGGLKPTQADKPVDRIKSMELGWFAIDECTETKEDYFLMLTSRLRLRLPDGSLPFYRGLLATNPEPGWVKARFIESDFADHVFIPAKATDNPYLPSDYVANLLKLFPEDWVERYLEGDWTVDEAGDKIFPYRALKEAQTREIEPGYPITFGLDVGGEAHGDATVLTMCEGSKVSILFRHSAVDTMKAVNITAEFADKLHPAKIRVDAIGVGEGVYSRLRELKYPVVKVIAGARATDKKKFFNLRSEMHWQVRERLQDGDLDLPEETAVLSEMSDIKWYRHIDKQIRIESKREMHTRGIKSPNISDSVVLAVADAREGVVPMVVTAGKLPDEERDSNERFSVSADKKQYSDAEIAERDEFFTSVD